MANINWIINEPMDEQGQYIRLGDKYKYSLNTYYRISNCISLVDLYHAMYPEAEIHISPNMVFRSSFCPFHNPSGKKYRFYIHEQDKYCGCYGCGKTAMSIDLMYHQFHPLTEDEVLEILSFLAGYPLCTTLNEQQLSIYDKIAKIYQKDINYFSLGKPVEIKETPKQMILKPSFVYTSDEDLPF